MLNGSDKSVSDESDVNQLVEKRESADPTDEAER